VGQFVAVYPVCEDSFVEYVLVAPCRTRERVYMRPGPNSYDFIYVYDYMFKEYDMRFPFTNFEEGMLRLMNIGPSQLHPNSWAFVRCFDLLCDQLGLEPSINIFTHFYQMKFDALVGYHWVPVIVHFLLFTTRPTNILSLDSLNFTAAPRTLKNGSSFIPTILLATHYTTGRDRYGFSLAPITSLLPRRKLPLMSFSNFPGPSKLEHSYTFLSSRIPMPYF